MLPLSYYNSLIGHAQVDRHILHELSSKLKWKLELPHVIRKHRLAPHVLVAMLRDDETFLHKCLPYTTLSGFQTFHVKLNRVVLRPEVIPLLNELLESPRTNKRKELVIYEVKNVLIKINRVVHVDRNKTNCSLANLREVQCELPDDGEPKLIHED